MLHTVALEKAYEDFFVSQVELLIDQKIFREYITSQSWSATFLSSVGSYQLAAIIFKRVAAHQKEILGLEHPDTLASMADLTLTFWKQGRWKEAEELGVQIFETRKRVLGPEHPDTLTGMANLALIYRDQGRWKEAEKLGVQTMEMSSRVLGLEHPSTLTSMANLASTYRKKGRWKEAIQLMTEWFNLVVKRLALIIPILFSQYTNCINGGLRRFKYVLEMVKKWNSEL